MIESFQQRLEPSVGVTSRGDRVSDWPSAARPGIGGPPGRLSAALLGVFGARQSAVRVDSGDRRNAFRWRSMGLLVFVKSWVLEGQLLTWPLWKTNDK